MTGVTRTFAARRRLLGAEQGRRACELEGRSHAAP